MTDIYLEKLKEAAEGIAEAAREVQRLCEEIEEDMEEETPSPADPRDPRGYSTPPPSLEHLKNPAEGDTDDA